MSLRMGLIIGRFHWVEYRLVCLSRDWERRRRTKGTLGRGCWGGCSKLFIFCVLLSLHINVIVVDIIQEKIELISGRKFPIRDEYHRKVYG